MTTPNLADNAPGIWDVVVIGGGNAGLVAALTARQSVERVLLLERAPLEERGGNTRHARNIRVVHEHDDAFSTAGYSFEALYDDLCRLGTGPSSEKLAEITVRASEGLPAWMSAHGVSFQQPLAGTLHLGETNRFLLGGGKALLNAYYRSAEVSGVTVAYEARVEALSATGDEVSSLVVDFMGRRESVRAHSVVCAAGSYEANRAWLARNWGDAASNYVVRGSASNDGEVLAALFELGVARAGDEKAFHAIAVDARAPQFDGGTATRLDCIPFGVALNRSAQRFSDEGKDLWPKRDASWGQQIAEQDGQIAYCVWDEKVNGTFLPPMFGPERATSIEELARILDLDERALISTVSHYNDAVQPGHFDPTALDDCRTLGLAPEKTHWAQRIDTPPYYGVTMRPGITFTYLGVGVDEDARVQRVDGSGFANVFAAGEIMAGNVLTSGYLAGLGLTIGTVWGRIAGSRAAGYATEHLGR